MDFKKLQNLWRLTLGDGTDLGTLDPSQSFKPPALLAEPPTPVPSDFQTFELLARGGGGEVYRARQSALRRDVALKRLRPEHWDSARAQAGFVGEGIVLGQLEHPNIVPVYGLGVTEDGLYLAMKLVGGETWRELLAGEAARDLDRQLEILLQTCNAIAFAHSKNIVHNDLKPDNIMVGHFGEVLVLDWGLAAYIGPETEGLEGVRCGAKVASPLGTPAYMAPELATGRGADIGPRTDVFLLGGLLYELLTGHCPHTGDDFSQVITRAAEGPVLQFGATAPEALRAVCRQAMATDPSQRHASVLAFQAEIRAFQRNQESLKIAAEAQRRLSELETLLSRDAEQNDEEINKLFGECRFGFRQALRVWPQNPQAHAGLQTSLERMLAFQLHKGAHTSAAALLSELDAPDAQLIARVQQLGRRQAREREELRALKQASNVRLGRSARTITAGVLALVWSGMCFTRAFGWFPPNRVNNIVLGLVFAVVLGGSLLIGRRSFFSNRYNRSIGVCTLGINLAIVLLRLYALRLEIPLTVTVALENWLFCVLFGMMALTVDRHFVWLSGSFLLATVASALDPGLAWWGMALAILCGLSALGLAWQLSPGEEAATPA